MLHRVNEERQLRVLVIDDSHDQYMLVRDMLTAIVHEGLDLEWAATYYEGLSFIESREFDVALVDYELGDHNGLDFIAKVRKTRPMLPLILLTGRGSREVDLMAMEAGAVDYLDKTQLRANMLERSVRYAIENQRIIDQERQQRTLAEALLDTAMTLTNSLDYHSVLHRILTNVGKVIAHDMANIMLVQDGYAYVVQQHGYEHLGLVDFINSIRLSVDETSTLRHMTETRSTLLLQDVAEFDDWIRFEEQWAVKSYLGSPILVDDRVIGFINLDSFQQPFFSQEHARYLQVFANQAGQAIRNTRAYGQAQELAAAEERQRLARELHDAVTQTLFSASVMAETLARIYDTQPERVKEGLEELVRMNRGALAEMRTLLVELRPQALLEQDLPRLLDNLVNAKRRRLPPNIQVLTRIDSVLPEDVHIALYRITQEALNNVEKYANAENLLVSVVGDERRIDLKVHDDGVGFDPGAVAAGHFGIQIMRERAEAIGARLYINSAPDDGTEIHLIWQANGVGIGDN
ncbi:MAG: response regulator [Anaerolineaceae bacterium]|nr:response regulator [Anaerolineaceae bacterium]